VKVVIQRVSNASVEVENKLISKIGQGILLLVCIESLDDSKTIELAATKILNYRIFSDKNGKMNLNILQSEGEILAVSQFTLSWNGKKGNRPSFDNSKDPKEALSLFDEFCDHLGKIVNVKKGQFGEHMNVSLSNDGPVTFSFEY